jgi:predicted MPP superfamily phosphohydrolase
MEEVDMIKKENEELKKKNAELENRLKKYTNGDNHKRYYEKNKDKIKEQGTNYLKKLKEENPDKLKEYRRSYYLKKKEKMNTEQNL